MIWDSSHEDLQLFDWVSNTGVDTNLEPMNNYRQTSNTSGILVGNKIVDHSDEVGASPDSAAQTTSSFSIQQSTPGFNRLGKDDCKTRRDEKHLSFGIWCGLYFRFDSS